MNGRVFVVERPLQILIALAIIDQIDDGLVNYIFVANCFSNAEHVVNSLNLSFSGKRTSFKIFPTYDEAFFFARKTNYSELFIHWDVGFRTSIRLTANKRMLPSGKIFVFEEGIGTYSDNIYSGVKKWFFGKIGVATNCGGHKTVETIFVYSPSEYISRLSRPAKAVVEITLSIRCVIKKYEECLLLAFDREKFLERFSSKEHDQCVVYMSSWEFKMSDLEFIQDDKTIKILKLHPHAKSIKGVSRGDILVCPNEIPAELLLTKIMNVCKDVKVFHHGSSVSRYVDWREIKFVDLSEKVSRQA